MQDQVEVLIFYIGMNIYEISIFSCTSDVTWKTTIAFHGDRLEVGEFKEILKI